MPSAKEPMKRFTVSLEASAYAELQHLARTHRPALSLQYVVRFALQRFLDESNGAQLSLNLNQQQIGK